MPNTMPEGVTPMPYLVEPPQQARPRSLLIVLSTVLGVVIGLAIVVGGLGRAFYVERTEYTNKLLLDAQDKIGVQKTLERLDVALNRLDSTSQKLADSVQELRTATAKRR